MSVFSSEPVLRYFEEISRIPRCSGNEKAVSDYLVEFAKARNLEVVQDDVLNVIIKKPGTPGYENAPTVIIQGHMDMVGDKNKGTEHNFEKDPIKLRVDGDMLYATNTTLGADNGIAVAYAMELLDSSDIPHPPIEILITTQEETGMDGALLLDPGNLKGKYLINIDGEEEGRFFVSCAGGIRVLHTLQAEWEDADTRFFPYLLSIKGLRGGHSGSDIHMGRGNSNKLMGRILNSLYKEIGFLLSDINGGMRPNAIPREAEAVILITPSDEIKLKDKIDEWNSTFKNELRVSDPGVIVSLENTSKKYSRVLSKEVMRKVIVLLNMIPNGIQTMSADISGLVESSTNLGVVSTSENAISFESAVRSSVRSLKHNIINQCEVVSDSIGARFEASSDYPEWEYDPDSKLREVFESVYEETYGKKPEVTAIHAGLECGLFKEKMPCLDMISFGPNLYDVHTPNEHVSTPSVKRTWEFIKAVLKEMR